MTRVARPLAWVWLLAVIGAGAFLILRLPEASIESSIFALLPEGEEEPVAREAGAALRAELEGRFLVLLAHEDAARAGAAAEAYAARLKAAPGMQSVTAALPDDGLDRLKAFYGRHRFALLTPEDRKLLKERPDELHEAALRTLYLPPGLGGTLGFQDDPFGTWGRWLASRGEAGAGFTLRDGHLTVDLDGKTAVAVLGTLGPRGRGMEAQRALAAEFAAAAEAARGAGGDSLRVLRSGFVFHELEAAKQAHREMTTIGTVSAVLLLLMMLAVFRGPRPALLAILSVAVGALAGTAALLLAHGGKVHLIAMVFGSTLLGVAEDYGMLFIAGLYGPPPWDGERRRREILRSILLGLCTSVLGYLALFFVPIPGLWQVGIFSITGLVAAWITVVLWFPFLSRGLKAAGPGAQAAAVAMADRWPSLRRNAWARWSVAALLLLSLAGLWRLRVDDDVRLLYARDPVLHAEQEAVGAALGLPSSGRYFLVRGRSEQEALEREERLLDALAAADPAGGRRAAGVTSWVPSRARQSADAALLGEAVSGPAGVGRRLEAELEMPGLSGELRGRLVSQGQPLDIHAWLASPLSTPFRHLWRGGAEERGDSAATVVPLPGSVSLEEARIAQAVLSVEGVTLVDQVQQVSGTLGLLRRHVMGVLAIGAAIVALAIGFLFRRRSFAALAPAALGVAAGLGGLGWSGQALNLFGLLALALIMGMGVHYGIFMHESAERRRPAALVAVNLGAATNLIAFGMLVFSTTPALMAFGLVLAAGLGTAWLTAPVFAGPVAGPGAHSDFPGDVPKAEKGGGHAA